MRHGRRDTTHAPIRDELRAVGFSVHDTADLGDDFPDLVAGYKGMTWLLECKSPGKDLRPGQVKARSAWRGGPWLKVESLADALWQMQIAAPGIRLPRAA